MPKCENHCPNIAQSTGRNNCTCDPQRRLSKWCAMWLHRIWFSQCITQTTSISITQKMIGNKVWGINELWESTESEALGMGTTTCAQCFRWLKPLPQSDARLLLQVPRHRGKEQPLWPHPCPEPPWTSLPPYVFLQYSPLPEQAWVISFPGKRQTN